MLLPVDGSISDKFVVSGTCRNLRERFGLDDMDYLNSLTKSPKPMHNPGKSGAKLYLSADKMYVIKTMTSEEIEEMHHLLKQVGLVLVLMLVLVLAGAGASWCWC